MVGKTHEIIAKVYLFLADFETFETTVEHRGAPMHIGSALAGFKKAFEAYIYRMRPASK